MLLMDYSSIRGGNLPDYSKQATCNLSHACIDANRQTLIYKYTGDGLQAIMILQPQCENKTFSEKISYNRLFQKVVHKEGES